MLNKKQGLMSKYCGVSNAVGGLLRGSKPETKVVLPVVRPVIASVVYLTLIGRKVPGATTDDR